MIKILSIIGTRPQYIKITPFYNYCKKNNINHIIVDTSQHYSSNVSSDLIENLNLKIDYFLSNSTKSELDFIVSCLSQIKEVLLKENPNFVLIYGDTNSTLAASLTCYKMNIPYGHVEAGLRCGDYSVPEEVNRVFCDMVSSINFCSSESAVQTVNGVFTGDFEYELLNYLNPNIQNGKYGIMTIHRQENMNKYKIEEIFSFCKKLNKEVKFYVHHRTKPLLDKMMIPKNVSLFDSIEYTKMINEIANSGFILTDSGGINKIVPFFGKKAIIFRDKIEWKETENAGYVKKINFNDESQIDWLLSPINTRQKDFYIGIKPPSEIVYNGIISFLNKGNINDPIF